jgi:hypothetical protein
MKVTECLRTVDDCAGKIRAGDHQAVSTLVTLVIGSDFLPRILTAAKAAMEPITETKPTWSRPFAQFNMTARNKMERPFYLGALFECLPAKTSQKMFDRLYLFHYPISSTLLTFTGHTLLRFNSSESAKEFAIGLYRIKPKEIKQLLCSITENREISGWRPRRYEAKELSDLCLTAIGESASPVGLPIDPGNRHVLQLDLKGQDSR